VEEKKTMERYFLSPGPLFFCYVNGRSGAFLLIFSFIALSLTHTYGQYEAKDFVKYTVKEGLSDNSITCIEQDHRGFIWIGTEFGLNRYDGYQFEKYFQALPEGFLTSSQIYKLRPFRDHRLAIMTRNGFQVINTDDFSIRQYVISDTTSFIVSLNFIMDAMEFHDGTIGASTASGFYVFDTSATLIFRHDVFGREDIGEKRILYGREMLSIPGDEVFAYVHENGQAVYNIEQRSFREVSSTEEQWKAFSQPSATGWRGISQISAHEYMFLSREDSVVYYDYNRSTRIAARLPSYYKDVLTWESKVFMRDDSTFFVNAGYHGFFTFYFNRVTGSFRFDSRPNLIEYKIKCFYKDQTDRIWIGTSDGLLKQKLQPAFTQVYHWPVEDIVRIGYSDAFRHKGKLYLGRFSRDIGMVIVDLASMEIESKFSFFGMNNAWNEVYTMQMYYPDTLWIGTYGGLLWFDTQTTQYGKVGDLIPNGNRAPWSSLTPIQDDGYSWMCDYLGGNVARYHSSSRKFDVFNHSSQPVLPFLKVKHICTDSYGDTWIGGHSLTRWNRKLNAFDTVITVYGGPNKYDDDIKILRADDQGSLWMHNAVNGLLQYKIQDRTWVHYGMKEGLPSEVIPTMSVVMDHTLWMTNHNQLIRFDTETGKMESYDQTDGIPDVKPVAWNMHVDTGTRELYVFYQDEVVILPFDYHQDTSSGGDLLFQQIIVNNAHPYFYTGQDLHLGTKENNITIHFTLVDFNEGQQNKFAYRMHSQDDWTNLGTQRTLHLTNLSPGAYTLEVAATSKSGVKKTNTLSFSIAPPFWTTNWFILVCMIVVAAVIYFIYRMRIAQFQQKANLDKLLSQTEMKALHAQMNPHFVFNSLNSIREMILNNETQEASRFLGNFAHLIRTTLDQSRQSFISLRSTMDYLNQYIEMEKIRNSDFHFSMEADPSIEPDETVLPPMLIQPFIENAIWHGMNGEDQEIHIRVQFKRDGDHLICIIEDDGIGIEHAMKMKNERKSGHQSVSIANIRKRIELLNRKHDQHSYITIEDKSTHAGYPGTGTIVTIHLPLEISEE
jgi:ligand-binding sensor domain-containing protein/two-component sensor histidine kinase